VRPAVGEYPAVGECSATEVSTRRQETLSCRPPGHRSVSISCDIPASARDEFEKTREKEKPKTPFCAPEESNVRRRRRRDALSQGRAMPYVTPLAWKPAPRTPRRGEPAPRPLPLPAPASTRRERNRVRPQWHFPAREKNCRVRRRHAGCNALRAAFLPNYTHS